jgi:hypothetical protein
MVSKNIGFYVVDGDGSGCIDIGSYKELMMYLKSPEKFFEYVENHPDIDADTQF